jgi:hypothetical protein
MAALATPAFAQDEPRFALVASLPTPAVSIQWEVSQKLALRFDGRYSFQSETVEESSTGGALEHIYNDGTTSQVIFAGSGTASRLESTSHSAVIGVTGIFTIHRADLLRLYVAPRIAVTLSRARIMLPGQQSLPDLTGRPLVPTTATYEDSSASPAVSASFGAAANLHRHFALFGEVGLNYARNDSPLLDAGISASGIGNGDTTSTAFSTRAIAGVMVLF